MAVFENSTIFLLMLGGLLINHSKAVIHSSKPVIEVPGLLIGSRIAFTYNGTDLSRVTLSIEDTIGKILHFALRPNEGCKGNPPEILFNTYTDGKFDKSTIINLPWLDEGNYWFITAEEDGFLIEGRGGPMYEEKYSHKFSYISPHKLSDIRKIRMYAGKGCGVGKTNFVGYLHLSQIIPKGFTKVLFEGVRPTDTPFVFSIESGEQRVEFSTGIIRSEMILTSEIVEHLEGNFMKNFLEIGYLRQNPIEGIIEKTSNSTYKATVLSPPDISHSYQITDMPAAEASGYVSFGFKKITKLEIN